MSATKALTGTLGDRPLAALLAAAAERAMTGTFTFGHGEGRSTLTVRDGAVAQVTTPAGVRFAYLGSILYESGVIDSTVLDQTLLTVATTKRLHGEVLLEGGFITRAELDEALAEQTCRKLQHLFGLSGDTTWRLDTSTREADDARDAGRPPVDALRALWRGLRERPICAHVRRTLARVEGPMQLRDTRTLARYEFTPEELAFACTLADAPRTLVDALSTSALSGERTQLVVYALALGRLLERARLETPGPAELGIEGIRARAAAIDDEEPHAVLGLASGATTEAARAAYVRLAKAWSPDRLPKELTCVRAECARVAAGIERAHRRLRERRDRPTPLVKPVSLQVQESEVDPTPMLERKGMRDVDRALADGNLDEAMIIARELSITGTAGPSARAVISWCEAAAGAASADVLERVTGELDRLLAADPDCVRALYYRALVARRLGRDAQSVKDLRRVARLDPAHEDAARELDLSEARAREMPTPAQGDSAARRLDTTSGSGLRNLFARVRSR